MILPNLLLVTALQLCALASPLPRDDSTQVLKPETHAYINSILNATDTPGLLVVVTSPKGDEIIPFGVADKAGNPITEETYFPIASNSKLITAVTLNILAEKNISLSNGEVFSVNSKVKDIIPGFQMYNESSTPEATVLDFLAHQSGVPAYALSVRPELTPQSWSDELHYWKTNHGLREAFEYSNINYAIASHIIEQVSGKSFYDTVQELVFDPLHLEATWDALEAKAKGNRSEGFLKQGVNITQCSIDTVTVLTSSSNGTAATRFPESCLGKTEAFEFWSNETGKEWVGGGSALLRGKDVLAWAKELLSPKVVSPELVRSVQTGVISSGNSSDPLFGPAKYAQGCVEESFRGYNISIHDGALPGALSLFVRVPNETIGVFIVSNDDLYGSQVTDVLMWTILDELLRLQPIDWVSRNIFGIREDSNSSSTPSNSTSSSNSSSSSTQTQDGGAAAAAAPVTVPINPKSAPEGYVNQTFRASGWTDFTLKLLNLSDPASTKEAAIPLDYLLTDVTTSLGGTLSFAGLNYYGYWGQSVGDRILFSQFDGALFNMTALKVYDRIPGEVETQQVPVNGSQYIAKLYGAAPAIFAENGIGIFGSLWGEGKAYESVPVVETNVSAQSIVFFGKVEE